MSAIFDKITQMIASSYWPAVKMGADISLNLMAYAEDPDLVVDGMVLVEVMRGKEKSGAFGEYHFLVVNIMDEAFLFMPRRELQAYIEDRCAAKKFAAEPTPNHFVRRDGIVYACLEMDGMIGADVAFIITTGDHKSKV